MLASTTIRCPEGPLHVVTAGDSGPQVLLLSGAGVDNAMLSWRHTIPALAASRRAYALDWPTQGGSRPWTGLADHEGLLRAIDAVVSHFEIERMAVVGLSQGGAMAIGYTLAHPEKIEALVAIAPAGVIDFPPGIHQLLYLAARLPRLTAWATRTMLSSREAVAAFARKSLFAGPVPDFDAVVDEIIAELAQGGGASDWQNHSIGPFRMRVDLRPRLGEITCPTLFVQGDRDVAVKAEHTRRAAALVPNAEFALFNDHGHWLNRQSPERFNALLLDFLDRAQPVK